MKQEMKDHLIKGKDCSIEIIFNKAAAKKRIISFLDEMLLDKNQQAEHENLLTIKAVIEDPRIKKINLKLNFKQNGKA